MFIAKGPVMAERLFTAVRSKAITAKSKLFYGRVVRIMIHNNYMFELLLT
jgi:hypothetical protein